MPLKITVTEAARTKLQEIQTKLGATAMLLGLQGGGCSGLKYIVRAATEKELNEGLADERVLFWERLVIDKKSLPYLEGMTVDYKISLLESRFVFNNPSAAKTCGCGTSFTPK